MVMCPKCKKEIEHLVIDVDASCQGTCDGERTGFAVDELLSNVDYGSDFMCPECSDVLFTIEEDAVHFLNGVSSKAKKILA